MKKKTPPLRLCVLILTLSLVWRMIGAPVTPQQFRDLKIPLTQMRILLPSRMTRVFALWLGEMRRMEPQTMLEDAEIENAQGTTLAVYVTQEGCIREMPLEGYVCGVLAAEMPAQYHLEALKAQAVAARTRALWQKERGGCAEHVGADICTDSAHCQGYATPAQCRERWQDSYEPYRDRILQAQRETAGNVLTYEGELITVLYHAISGGMTEDAQNVFSESLPYLVSVESAGEESAMGFRQDQTLSYEEIAQRLNEGLPQLAIGAEEIRRSFSIGGYTDSGRVQTVQIAGHEMSAAAFRRMLGLRSTWFSVSGDAQGLTFHQRGYGHGVGMSQAGANAMAAEGESYRDILLHYYTGVQIEAYEASPLRTGYSRRDAYAAKQPVQEQPSQAVPSI